MLNAKATFAIQLICWLYGAVQNFKGKVGGAQRNGEGRCQGKARRMSALEN